LPHFFEDVPEYGRSGNQPYLPATANKLFVIVLLSNPNLSEPNCHIKQISLSTTMTNAKAQAAKEKVVPHFPGFVSFT
jgi:hypothetical protein